MAAEKSGEERLRDRKPLKPPVPAYLAKAGSPLSVDKDLYQAIQQGPRTLVESFTLPIRSGRAWKAPAKSIIRISTPEGAQVGMLKEFSCEIAATYLCADMRGKVISIFGMPMIPERDFGRLAPSSSIPHM